jgi:hypothetical protein
LIERNKAWVAVASIIVIAVCLFAAQKAYRGDELPDVISKVYFSDDDGKTYFAAGIENGIDFTHDGKHAFRAYVYRCDSGKAFVGFLGRGSGGHGAAPAAPDPQHPGAGGSPTAGIEIKKPGQAKWVAFGSVEGQAIIRSLCPSGSPESVLP